MGVQPQGGECGRIAACPARRREYDKRMTAGRARSRMLGALAALLVMPCPAFAQTQPAPQSLPCTQNFGSATFTTAPAGMAAWNGLNGGGITSALHAANSAPQGDAAVSAATAAQTTGGCYGLMTGGNARFYIQTSSNATNGVNQLVLALDTTGWTNVALSYDVEIINAKPRTIGVLCQYRVGTSGAWTSLAASSGGNPYSQAGGTAGVKTSPQITLPPPAENQPVVQIRWAVWRGTETGDSSGAAVDNISVSGSAAGAVLSASVVPGMVAESDGAGAAQLTVSRTGSTDAPLAVTLAISDTSALAYDGPNPFPIPAGQSSATVPLRAVDNDVLDGDKTVTLTVTAPASVAAQATIQVLDDEDAFSPPPGYYADAVGLSGSALKAALKIIASPANYNSYAYSDTFNPLRSLDQDPASSGNIVTIYSGASLGKNAVYFPGGPDADSSWSREHIWPDSYGLDPDNANPGAPDGGDAGPDFTDLFNLRPCVHSVNVLRGNRYFDPTSGTPSIPALAPLCSYDSNSWQPRPEERGDIARAMFYMAARYDGSDPLTLDLELSNTPNAAAGRFGRLSTLLRWHEEDPVSLEERQRNHRIYTTYQRNRNPFVDRPGFAAEVWGHIRLDKTAATVTEGQPGTDAVLSLAAAPAADVTLSFQTSPAGQVSVSPPSLTFTQANWDQPQSLSISAVDDSLFEAEMTVTLSTAITTADTRYAALEVPPVPVTVISDDPLIQPAALPLSHGGPWSPLPSGFLGEGLGAPYGSSLGGDTAAGSARFDTTGARLVIGFNAPAETLTYHLRGNPADGSATSGSFHIRHSADGLSFTSLRVVTDKNNTDQLFTDSVPRSARYLEFIYSQKNSGNIQLDKLGITAAPSFISWAAARGLSGVNAGVLVDAELDGFTNLAEYALAGHPLQHDAAAITPAASRAGGHLRITAVIRADDPDLGVQAVTTADLGMPESWTATGVVQIQPVDQSGVPPGFERVTFQSPLTGGRAFMRLVISLQGGG